MLSYENQGAERLITVLECVGDAGRPVTVAEIARASGFHRGTVFRILAVLHKHAYVHKNPRAKTYTLGYKLFLFGTHGTRMTVVTEHARPFIRRLAFDVGMTTHLGTIEGPQILYCDKVEPPGGVPVFTRVGMRLDAHATALGKALLAQRPEEIVREIYRFHPMHRHTAKTAGTVEELLDELRQAKRQGYAVENGEAVAGVACIAAPIPDVPGGALLSISVAGNQSQLAPERMRSLADKVCATAAEIGDYIARRELPDPRLASEGA